MVALCAMLPALAGAWEGGYSQGFEPYPDAPLCTTELDTSVSGVGGERSMEHRSMSVDFRIRVVSDSVTWLDTATISIGKRTFLVALDSAHSWNLARAFYADLNNDSQPDLVLEIPSGGCGMGSEYSTLVIGLSGQDGYGFHMVNTMGFGARSFLRARPGSCRLVASAFVYGEPGTDRKTHNYWVHSRLAIDGTNLAIEPAKPKWIAYMGKANHRETQLLTPAQKDRLWLERGDDRPIRRLRAVEKPD